MGPDGRLYIADRDNNRIRRIQSALPDVSLTDIQIASEDGSELYVFSGSGRHLQTLDTLTGALRYQFGYNDASYLTSVTDGSGNVTTIERPAASAPHSALTATAGCKASPTPPLRPTGWMGT
jgi:YD repeat-containing protein